MDFRVNLHTIKMVTLMSLLSSTYLRQSGGHYCSVGSLLCIDGVSCTCSCKARLPFARPGCTGLPWKWWEISTLEKDETKSVGWQNAFDVHASLKKTWVSLKAHCHFFFFSCPVDTLFNHSLNVKTLWCLRFWKPCLFISSMYFSRYVYKICYN